MYIYPMYSTKGISIGVNHYCYDIKMYYQLQSHKNIFQNMQNLNNRLN